MGHWYDKNGTPVYEVPNVSKGGMRPTTIRDARRLSLVPSVTTVLGVMDKPALVRWFKEQTALAAWETDRYEPKERWVEEVLRRSTETSDTAADIGTEIHDALEKSRKGEPYPDDYEGIVAEVEKAIRAKFGDRKWVVEKAFASPLGFGGKADLHCAGATPIVLDYKTKDTLFSDAGKLKKLAWPNHIQQLAAYAHGLGIYGNNLRCANVFVDYRGAVHIHEWTKKEIRRGWEIFEAALKLWKLVNNYDPQG